MHDRHGNCSVNFSFCLEEKISFSDWKCGGGGVGGGGDRIYRTKLLPSTTCVPVWLSCYSAASIGAIRESYPGGNIW